MTCDRFDVVVVPFPFSEKPGSKRRPAVVLSNKQFNDAGHTVLAMITTKGHNKWPGDQEISDLETAGLPLPCIVRLKLFTLDNRLLQRKIGHLANADSKSLSSALDHHCR